jgi:hypothetical protein
MEEVGESIRGQRIALILREKQPFRAHRVVRKVKEFQIHRAGDVPQGIPPFVTRKEPVAVAHQQFDLVRRRAGGLQCRLDHVVVPRGRKPRLRLLLADELLCLLDRERGGRQQITTAGRCRWLGCQSGPDDGREAGHQHRDQKRHPDRNEPAHAPAHDHVAAPAACHTSTSGTPYAPQIWHWRFRTDRPTGCSPAAPARQRPTVRAISGAK